MTKLDELEKLQKLRDSNTITDVEFERMKESILKNGITIEENLKTVGSNIDTNTWCSFIHLS